MCNKCTALAVIGVDVAEGESVSSIQAYSTTISGNGTSGLTFDSIQETMEKYKENMRRSSDIWDYYREKYREVSYQPMYYKRAGYDEDDIRKLIRLVSDTATERQETREEALRLEQENVNKMNIRQELKKLTKGEDQVLLEEAGLVDATGELTREGEEEVMSRLFKQVKEELVADLKKIKEKKDKKKS